VLSGCSHDFARLRIAVLPNPFGAWDRDAAAELPMARASESERLDAQTLIYAAISAEGNGKLGAAAEQAVNPRC